MAENPRKIEWNAYKNFVLSSAFGKSVRNSVQKSVQKSKNPKNPSKNPSKILSTKSVQKIRPKTPSKYPCHFVIAIVPIGFVSARPVLKTSTSNLNVFMGLMATLREGCLQVYICSRDGQIETKILNLKSLVPHFCENASATSLPAYKYLTGTSINSFYRPKSSQRKMSFSPQRSAGVATLRRATQLIK